MAADSVRLNEQGVIKTRGAHHPLKMELIEAIKRPDMHMYAPYAVLAPERAALQHEPIIDDGFVTDLLRIQVWQEGVPSSHKDYWQTIPTSQGTQRHDDSDDGVVHEDDDETAAAAAAGNFFF